MLNKNRLWTRWRWLLPIVSALAIASFQARAAQIYSGLRNISVSWASAGPGQNFTSTAPVDLNGDSQTDLSINGNSGEFFGAVTTEPYLTGPQMRFKANDGGYAYRQSVSDVVPLPGSADYSASGSVGLYREQYNGGQRDDLSDLPDGFAWHPDDALPNHGIGLGFTRPESVEGYVFAELFQNDGWHSTVLHLEWFDHPDGNLPDLPGANKLTLIDWTYEDIPGVAADFSAFGGGDQGGGDTAVPEASTLWACGLLIAIVVMRRGAERQSRI